MAKKLGIFLLVVSSLYLGAGYFTDLRSYQKLPSRDVTRQLTLVSIDIGELRKKGELQEVEKKKLFLLRGERTKIQAEMFIRQYYVDQIVMLLFIISLFMLLASRLRTRGASVPGSKDAFIRDMDIETARPAEEYVDEWELEQRVTTGFPSKEAAIKWLKSDPMLKCDYCGAQLRSTFTGQREAVRLTTFYKKVPEGAKDLRVVLGSYWFAVHADELRCSQCGKVVQR